MTFQAREQDALLSTAPVQKNEPSIRIPISYLGLSVRALGVQSGAFVLLKP